MWAYGSIQDIRKPRGAIDLSQGRDGILRSRGPTRPAARVRITRSSGPTTDLVYSHGFYGNFTREDVAASAARARRPGRSQGEGRAGRRRHPIIRPAAALGLG